MEVRLEEFWGDCNATKAAVESRRNVTTFA
jgi:hypothetical protein